MIDGWRRADLAPAARLPDRPGLIARVSGFLAESGLNIVDVDQHSSAEGRFFMRMVFDRLPTASARRWSGASPGDRRAFEMDYEFDETGARKRVAVMVSREDHCLSTCSGAGAATSAARSSP